MTVLQTKSLTKIYGDKAAVENVSMTIKTGDIYGFVGENGAGKTTFIRLISRLIKPNSGTFELFEGNNLPIGAVVETPSLYLNMTAMDNLMTQAKIIGHIDLNRHQELLSLVKLEYLINSKKKAKDFSLGMKQRLGIAMSLLSNPKFILLDEPMNGLDPEGVVLIRNLIRSLNEQGITFLISSHMLAELSKIATRYGFIHQGRLIQEITKDELEEKVISFSELKIKKDDIIEAKEILEQDGYNVEMVDSSLRLYGNILISDVILKLSKSNISVLSIKQETNNIEEYYLELVGGQHD